MATINSNSIEAAAEFGAALKAASMSLNAFESVEMNMVRAMAEGDEDLADDLKNDLERLREEAKADLDYFKAVRVNYDADDDKLPYEGEISSCRDYYRNIGHRKVDYILAITA